MEPTQGRIKIIIADDHALILHSLEMMLESVPDFIVVGTASNGEEVFDINNGLKPDIILMDIKMPKLNGLEAIRIIEEKMPWVKVIALSIYDHPHIIKEALKSGAKGFLSKNCSFEELCEAIRMVHSGKTYLCNSVSETVLYTFINNDKDSIDAVERLTPSEIKVVKLLTEGMITREISKVLFVSEKTVERHKSNILKKLKLKNTAQLVRFAVEKGILLT